MKSTRKRRSEQWQISYLAPDSFQTGPHVTHVRCGTKQISSSDSGEHQIKTLNCNLPWGGRSYVGRHEHLLPRGSWTDSERTRVWIFRLAVIRINKEAHFRCEEVELLTWTDNNRCNNDMM